MIRASDEETADRLLEEAPWKLYVELSKAAGLMRHMGLGDPDVELQAALESGVVEFRGKSSVGPDGTEVYEDILVNVGGLQDWVIMRREMIDREREGLQRASGREVL